MRTILMVAVAALAASVVPARADSLSGEVVDLACYMVHPQSGQGASHKKCAQMCAKKGMPLGLLTDDKQVYLLLEDHENEKPFADVKAKAGEKVTVEGDKVSQGGLQGLVVESVK
jgi:hypothetical protein